MSRKLIRSHHDLDVMAKKSYEAAFVAKLNDAETEPAETQTWLTYSKACEYLDNDRCSKLNQEYDNIIGKIVNMINNPKPWVLKNDKKSLEE